jgi:predicted DNA-binding antitoxin AbrB/MazE fold protein
MGIRDILGGRGGAMEQPIEAIYKDGILRPLQKLSLRQKQRVTLHIEERPANEELEDKGFLEYCRSEGDPNISLEVLRQAMAVIPGSMTEACSAERHEETLVSSDRQLLSAARVEGMTIIDPANP